MLRALLVIVLTCLGLQAQTGYYATQTVATNVATNVFVSAAQPALSVQSDFAVSAALVSPSNHVTTTVTLFWQFTADGTNWTRTNSVDAFVGTTYNGSNGVSTLATNVQNQYGYNAVRIAGWTCSTVTNTHLTNVTIGTWRR